jgi:DNA repair protein RadA/Sms
MVLAVLQRRGGETIRMSTIAASDVYAATVGGVRLTEPATDLAVALAVAGAANNEPLATGLVAIGEVGLAGEIRRVTGTARRLAEAARLGFTHALVPPDPGKVPRGIEVIEVRDLAMALRVAYPGAEVIPFASRRH